MKVKCKSGVTGWRNRLRKNYANFEEFEMYSEIYGISRRLGYKSAKTAWRANPMIEGSVNPDDLRKVPITIPSSVKVKRV